MGLNLQAASIVILCEPQTKPTTESQAIARAHRMGQVSTVQVHRLLVVDSVDEHLIRILDTKRHLFDAYARRSALAEEVASAVDVSEAELARQIVDAERTRLFVDPNVLSTEDAPAGGVAVEDVAVEGTAVDHDLDGDGPVEGAAVRGDLVGHTPVGDAPGAAATSRPGDVDPGPGKGA